MIAGGIFRSQVSAIGCLVQVFRFGCRSRGWLPNLNLFLYL
jgi:hypothetical protein